jgi:2-succinyl-6-hydroxy-2,4-cyclohexadiene-1-carboxylate synthase
MSRLDLGQIHLNVEERGHGPALVLLHGFTGSAADWSDHVDCFARSHRTLAVDLPGHGCSDAPNDPALYGMKRFTDDLATLLDMHQIETARWLGYSMGGRIALSFAVRHPERVERLVLEAASPGIADPHERQERIARDETLAASIERDGVETFVDDWMSQPLFASQTRLGKAALAAARDARRANNPTGLSNSLRGAGAGAQEPLWDRLHEVGAPVLLIAGDEDAKFRSIAQAMAARFPNARVAFIAAAGHNTHLENPLAFQRIILDFLKDTETAPRRPNGR